MSTLNSVTAPSFVQKKKELTFLNASGKLKRILYALLVRKYYERSRTAAKHHKTDRMKL